MPQVACKMCGKDFYIKPNRQKRGWGDYCSNACKYRGMFKGSLFTCATCGAKIYRTPTQVRKSNGGVFFCNKSCHAKAKNAFWPSGEKHFNWKGGEHAYRQMMLNRVKQPVCEDCGITDLRVLIVHHIDHDRRHNQPENLRWLCRNCHYLVHEGKTV